MIWVLKGTPMTATMTPPTAPLAIVSVTQSPHDPMKDTVEFANGIVMDVRNEASRKATWGNAVVEQIKVEKCIIYPMAWRPCTVGHVMRNSDSTITYHGTWGVQMGYVGTGNTIGTVTLPYATFSWTLTGDLPTNADSMINAAANLAAARIDAEWADKINEYLVNDKDKREQLRTNYILALVEHYKDGSGGGSGQVTKGTRVRVVRGRKVAKGTEGVIIWLGSSTYMGKTVGRCGIKDDKGTVHWTATANVDTIGSRLTDEQAIQEAKSAYVCCGGDWILGPIRN